MSVLGDKPLPLWRIRQVPVENLPEFLRRFQEVTGRL
jgi:hypothetical protein